MTGVDTNQGWSHCHRQAHRSQINSRMTRTPITLLNGRANLTSTATPSNSRRAAHTTAAMVTSVVR